LTAHRLRLAYGPPKQSKFRVASVLRFIRLDGTEGTIEAVNAEPHDANIRGAICAERAALCQFQRDEASRGSRISRCVCVTDSAKPFYPGPCCREFLLATCSPEVQVAVAGSAEPRELSIISLGELLLLPSVYQGRGQDEIVSLGSALGQKAAPPSEQQMASAFNAAVACARRQAKQASVFPVLFAAAVSFADGRVHVAAELKGIEYGCTVDAGSLLLTDMLRNREEGGAKAVCIVQADHFGVGHAPFASARSLLIEHGFGDVLTSAHDQHGAWAHPISVRASLPHADYSEML